MKTYRLGDLYADDLVADLAGGNGLGHGGEPRPGLRGRGHNLLLGEEEAGACGNLVPQLQPEGRLDPGLVVSPVHARTGGDVNNL